MNNKTLLNFLIFFFLPFLTGCELIQQSRSFLSGEGTIVLIVAAAAVTLGLGWAIALLVLKSYLETNLTRGQNTNESKIVRAGKNLYIGTYIVTFLIIAGLIMLFFKN